jgi:hypothetical protein
MSSVNDFIGPNEEVKFIGTYDVSTRVVNPGSDEYSGASGLITEIAGICGLSQRALTYVYTSSGLIGAPRFVFENYALTTIDDKTNSYLGMCIWQGSYPDVGSLGITTTPIFGFQVVTASGVYTGIRRVVIDFTNVNRVLYFVGLKE